ncbi:DUF1800 domain-containing protein [Roseovarius indicus]|uniref:DUF1800 domain-containing protein n=1 Tax=Roseovarius indicus TaxID=540747 RepID=UPI0032EE4B6E
MSFDPERAAIRFGCGLSPRIAPPTSVEDMLSRLSGPDHAAKAFPVPDYQTSVAHHFDLRDARKAKRRAKTDAERNKANKAIRQVRQGFHREAGHWFANVMLRRALSEDAFRERLTAFWADHFTALHRGGPMRYGHVLYADEAIRPHVAGRFSDMLRAAATHPLMLNFLDQGESSGPNSAAAAKKERFGGLNENLAREMLELHTLGVNGPYTQADVRQLAELLTGLSYGMRKGFIFRPDLAEPGPESVLSVEYGGTGRARLEDIYAALDDLARHPATARHIARKLAVHFVSDTPDEGLVEAMTARYTATDGHLPEVYAEMLSHPAAWADAPGNVKQPMDFIGSSLRALDIVPRHMPADKNGQMRRMFYIPLELMGQAWGQPLGPDGWEEADDAWITPQRLAARLIWGMTVPFQLRRVLPDPRDFVETALGGRAPEEVRFAARAAETRAEGIGIVLASPAFQRM